MWVAEWKWFILLSLVHIDSICSGATIPTYSPDYGGKGDLSAFPSLEDTKVDFDSLVLDGIREQDMPRSNNVYCNCMISGNMIRPGILLNASYSPDKMAESTGGYDHILVPGNATIQHMLFTFPFDPGRKFLPTTCYSSLLDVYREYEDMHCVVKLSEKLPHQITFMLDQFSEYAKLRAALLNAATLNFSPVRDMLEIVFFRRMETGMVGLTVAVSLSSDPGGTTFCLSELSYMKSIEFHFDWLNQLKEFSNGAEYASLCLVVLGLMLQGYNRLIVEDLVVSHCYGFHDKGILDERMFWVGGEFKKEIQLVLENSTTALLLVNTTNIADVGSISGSFLLAGVVVTKETIIIEDCDTISLQSYFNLTVVLKKLGAEFAWIWNYLTGKDQENLFIKGIIGSML